MLKQDAVFHWDEMANLNFQRIKDLIAKTASQLLRYYDQTKPVTVQADASQRELGFCLIQEGQPIAFASKSLTNTETRYANIEHEVLAIVFACRRFNTYVLRRPFTVESDHKPLEKIHQKILASGPPRLQRMLFQLQSISTCDIMYIIILCDHQVQTWEGHAACRCHSQASDEIKLSMRVNYIAFNKTWMDLILSTV